MARLFLLLPVCLLLHDQRAYVQNFASYLVPRETAATGHNAIAQICKHDPPRFLQMSLDRYERAVNTYSCLLCKRERVKGRLLAAEEVEVFFKERPHSVFMNWRSGANLARKALYVKGENDDRLLALPAGLWGLAGVQTRKVDHPDLTRSGRYLINEFGIKLGTERTLRDMLHARDAGTLRVQYQGVFEVPQLDNCRCYKLVRNIDPAEEDGVTKAVFYFNAETWLQIGTVLYDADGGLIAEYFFREVRLNAEFSSKQFKREAL